MVRRLLPVRAQSLACSKIRYALISSSHKGNLPSRVKVIMKEKRFKRRVMTVIVACTLLASYAPSARGVQQNSLPHLRRQGTATQLVVD